MKVVRTTQVTTYYITTNINRESDISLVLFFSLKNSIIINQIYINEIVRMFFILFIYNDISWKITQNIII